MTYRITLGVLLFAAAAHAQTPVGLLSLVSGDVQIVRSGQQNPTAARTADLLAAGDRVLTGADGEATFLFCPQSKTAKLGSGAEIEFADGAYEVKKGTVSGERQVPSCKLPATLTLASASQVQSGMLRLRGANLLLRSPSRTNTATLRPEFRWEPVDQAQKYEVRVLDREERILWRAEVTGTAAAYPADATPLQWGQRYRWRVTARDEYERSTKPRRSSRSYPPRTPKTSASPKTACGPWWSRIRPTTGRGSCWRSSTRSGGCSTRRRVSTTTSTGAWERSPGWKGD